MSKVEEKATFEHHIYFYRTHAVQTKKKVAGDRIPLVIQSATPVVYPIIMKLLQSPDLMSRIKIEELKIWEKFYPGKGNLPNAGVLFRGDILRDYPDVAEIFMRETANAVEWVKANPQEAAKLSYDIMCVTPEEAELFLSRVNFNYRNSEDVIGDVSHYIHVLNEAGYGRKEFGDMRELFVS